MSEANQAIPDAETRREIRALMETVVAKAPGEAAKMVQPYPDSFVAEMLALLNPAQAQQVLARLPSERRQKVMAAASAPTRQQWVRNDAYPENSVGHMMEPALAVFPPDLTVGQATEALRLFVSRALITYVLVADEDERLLGLVAMREMLMADPAQQLEDIMIRDPFRLHPQTELVEAMRSTMVRHYPVYPVCETDGKLVGVIRGQMLFEARTVELSLQAGSMVGLEREERLATRWTRSFRFRHPWLQANLFLGFIAAGVVGSFQGTIDRLVILAVFVPVVIGQSSNTAVQTLAVALRSITLGELGAGKERRLLLKETFLGVLNGMLTGISAALAMYLFATFQKSPNAVMLGLVVFLAMTASCLVAGIFGALIPLILRRVGSDPALASSILLTTITDVASLAVFLGLATWLI